MAKKRQKKSMLLPLEGSFPDEFSAVSASLSRRYQYVDEIAKGKTGLACKLRSNLNQDHFYCLKTVRHDITDREKIEAVRETLRKEVLILSPLSHRCLPTIYEHGLDESKPYYVCTYHPGSTFGKFKEQGQSLSFQETVFVLSSLLDVLKYLHDNGRTHCDLHQNNVMICCDVLRHGVLVIDFSSGHRDSDSSPFTANRGNVNFKDPQDQRHSGVSVDRREFSVSFQHSDFNALGKLLAIMRGCFIAKSPPATQAAYDDFSQSLQSGKLDSWTKIEDRFLSVLDPYRVVTENGDLFLSKRGVPQEITIPVSRGVPVGEAPLAVINTPIFQRLRSIKQLSFCDWYFPGANHTRFEHSLGTFAAAKQAAEGLAHDRTFRELFSPQQVRAFLLGSLLHDIGHYPYAHVVEQYAASRFPEDNEVKRAVSHEKHAITLLECDGELTEAICRHWGDDTLQMTIKLLESNVPVLSDLLDGPIDLDKVDYLTRDAAHCGVAFGAGLDIRGLVRSLRCIDNGTRLGIEETGVPAAEGLMVLQDQMLSSVYWHERIRGIISMFHAVLAHIVRKDVEALKALVQDLKTSKGDHDALSQVLWPRVSKLAGPEGELLRKLVELHLAPKYSDIYVPLKTYRRTDRPHARARHNIYSTIVSEGYSQSTVPIDWRCVSDLRTAFADALKEKGVEIHRLHLVVDVPYGKNARRMVHVQRKDGDGHVPITELSHLNRSIFEQPAVYLSPVRVYIAPDIYRRIEPHLASIIESAEEKFNSGGVADEVEMSQLPI